MSSPIVETGPARPKRRSTWAPNSSPPWPSCFSRNPATATWSNGPSLARRRRGTSGSSGKTTLDRVPPRKNARSISFPFQGKQHRARHVRKMRNLICRRAPKRWIKIAANGCMGKRVKTFRFSGRALRIRARPVKPWYSDAARDRGILRESTHHISRPFVHLHVSRLNASHANYLSPRDNAEIAQSSFDSGRSAFIPRLTWSVEVIESEIPALDWSVMGG